MFVFMLGGCLVAVLAGWVYVKSAKAFARYLGEKTHQAYQDGYRRGRAEALETTDSGDPPALE